MEDTSASVSENLLAFGPSHFISKVVVPLAAEVEDIANQYPAVSLDATWKLKLQGKPQADFHLMAGLVGVVAFIGSWGAKKALDELWESKLGPVLRRAMRDFLQPTDASDKKYGISLLVNKSPEHISILIAAVGCTLEEIERSEKQIPSVIATGLQQAQHLGKSEQVHLYIIEGGSVNVHPWVYANITEAMQHLSRMAPAKLPKFLANGS